MRIYSVQFVSDFIDELYQKIESFLDNSSALHLFISILISVISAILFILYIYLYIKSKQSLQWHNVKGTVLKSELDELCMGSGDPVTYKAKIEYSYAVADKMYYSKRIFYGDFLRHTFPFSSEDLIDKYKEGDVISVFYNPHNPEEAVLQQGIHSGVTRILITALLMVVVIYFYYNVFK